MVNHNQSIIYLLNIITLTPEYSNKSLERENFTNLINQSFREFTKKIKGQPNITNHNCQWSFIS